MQEIALWPSTNVSMIYVVVLAGSQSTFTEITEYIYFSPLKPSRELKYKSEWILVPLDLIIEPLSFLWNMIFTFYYTCVRPQCDFSILGRNQIEGFQVNWLESHSRNWQQSFVSHACMSHVTHMDESCLTYEWVMSHIWTSHVTYMQESCHIFECVMPDWKRSSAFCSIHLYVNVDLQR